MSLLLASVSYLRDSIIQPEGRMKDMRLFLHEIGSPRDYRILVDTQGTVETGALLYWNDRKVSEVQC